MNCCTSSTLRAMRLIVTTLPRLGSMRGRNDVMRTLGGSVASNSFHSAVQENVRRSISSFA